MEWISKILKQRQSALFAGQNSEAFTLIELLVVIAIIAILSVVVILTLNPAELLKQSRDSNRLSDLATMNNALGIYSTDIGGSLGNGSTTYISIPDPSATSTTGDQCQGLGLPSVSASTGQSYQCAASSTSRSSNGTGWIPVNFSSISSGAPIGALPIDPTNQTSSNLYYTFTGSGTQYEVTTIIESQKYKTQYSANAPVANYPEVIAAGSSLSISNLFNPNGLVGYWPMDEGSGSSTADYSGNSFTGTWGGNPGGTNGYYSAGKIGTWAGAFNGANTIVNIGNAAPLQLSAGSASAWIKTSGVGGGYAGIVVKQFAYGMFLKANVFETYDWSGAGDRTTGINLADSQWHLVAVTFQSGVASGTILYIDGVAKLATTMTVSSQTTAMALGSGSPGTGNQFFNGSIDDARVYNRVLSAAEIQALYNAQK